VLGCAISVPSAAAAFAAVTTLSGMGLGWIRQVNSSVPVVNWLSLPTSLASLWHAARGLGFAHTADGTVEGFRTAGTVLTLVVLVVLWAAARRWPPLTLCAIALTVTVLLGPSVQPWYYAWALVIVAVTAPVGRRRPISWLAFGSIALLLITLPEGDSILGSPLSLLAVLATAGLATHSALGKP
jgi:hypothetical protein